MNVFIPYRVVIRVKPVLPSGPTIPIRSLTWLRDLGSVFPEPMGFKQLSPEEVLRGGYGIFRIIATEQDEKELGDRLAIYNAIPNPSFIISVMSERNETRKKDLVKLFIWVNKNPPIRMPAPPPEPGMKWPMLPKVGEPAPVPPPPGDSYYGGNHELLATWGK